MLVFGHATDAVMVGLGMTPQYLVETGTSLFTLEAHVRYLDQVPAGRPVEVRSSVIGVTGKLLWLWHEMWCDDRLRATRRCSWSTSTRPPGGPARSRTSCGRAPRRCGCRHRSTRPAASPWVRSRGS